MLLSEARKNYQSDKKNEGYSPLTLKMYGYQYRLLNRYFGNIKMDEFTTGKLKQYLIEAIYAHLSGKLKYDLYSK